MTFDPFHDRDVRNQRIYDRDYDSAPNSKLQTLDVPLDLLLNTQSEGTRQAIYCCGRGPEIDHDLVPCRGVGGVVRPLQEGIPEGLREH